jgi:hypothetical protein
VARHFEAPHLESHPTPTDEFVDDLRYAALAYLRADSILRGASTPSEPTSGSPSRSK